MACLIFRGLMVFSALHSGGKLPQDINTAAARFVSLGLIFMLADPVWLLLWRLRTILKLVSPAQVMRVH